MKRALQWLLRLATFAYLIFLSLMMGLATVPAILIVRAAWETGSMVLVGLALGGGYLLFGLTLLAMIVALKYLTFFRATAGDYPFVSLYAVRWAFIGTFVWMAKLVVLRNLVGMPILNLFYRLMGARIGRNVIVNTCNIFDFDLLEIGDDTVIGGDAVIIGHVGEAGFLRQRPIRIGRGCTVGQSAIIFPGAVMEDGSVLGALSLLPKGRKLPAGTRWGGNPLLELHPGASPAGGPPKVDA